MKESIGEYYPIEGLQPHPKNPRHNEDAVEEVARSIKRFGFASPIIAREQDKTIIAGHTRWKAAKQIGLSKVPVVFMNLSVTDAEMLMIADNKLGEKADWDQDKLSELLSELKEQGEDLDVLGFEPAEMDDLIGGLIDDFGFGDGEGEQEAFEDDYEPVSKKGEIYHLGEHRLMCGDSKVKENWDLLMEGEEVDMVFTDPPYGVSYVGKTEDALTIQNDDLTGEELYEFLRSCFDTIIAILKKGGACYVASPAGDLQYQFMRCLIEVGLFRHKLVWVKHTFAMGRADYHYQHEDIFYGWKEGAGHYFINDRTKSTTLFFDKPSRNEIHPTMKPVELIEELINNSSRKGEIVIDAFGGSGSTMIAAAKTRRKSRLMELDPKYCDAIRKRWAKFAKDNNLPIGDGLE